MAMRFLTFLILLFGCACSAPANEAVVESDKVANFQQDVEDKEDLRTAASSSVSRRYADWNSYPSSATYGGGYGYGVTGYNSQDSRYNSYYSNGYDNNGYGGSGVYGGYGSGGYGGAGYGSSGYGGYGSTGYDGYSRGGGYGLTGYSSNGGYGGWGGNGGLSSYYGYNSPGYQGSYNVGYGYYNNRRPGVGYGNIYSGITPSLVTGYRGYSKK